MRRISKSRAAAERRLAPTLQAYRQEFPMCQIFGCKNRAVAIHEIVRGASRFRARQERALILAVCGPCHDDLGRFTDFPLMVQLAHKMIADPSAYSLETALLVRGFAPGAIEQWEVDLIVKALTKGTTHK